MNRTEYLLVKLAEECSEVAQRATKALTFGLDEVQEGQKLTNSERILLEFNDLLAVIDMLKDEAVFDEDNIVNKQLMEDKKQKIEKYMLYSQQIGTLDERYGDFERD